jgi:hypothetical protein
VTMSSDGPPGLFSSSVTARPARRCQLLGT